MVFRSWSRIAATHDNEVFVLFQEMEETLLVLQQNSSSKDSVDCRFRSQLAYFVEERTSRVERQISYQDSCALLCFVCFTGPRRLTVSTRKGGASGLVALFFLNCRIRIVKVTTPTRTIGGLSDGLSFLTFAAFFFCRSGGEEDERHTIDIGKKEI